MPFSPQDENAPAIGLLEDEPQAAHLLGAIRDEIRFMGKQVEEKIRQLRKVFQRGLLDVRFVHEKSRRLWHKAAAQGSTVRDSG